jgi:hypothetical protein
MYALVQENGHAKWKEWWYAFTLKVSLWTDLYITWKDQVFVVDVVIINPMWETMALSVITQPVGAIAKHNAIDNIHNYRRFHEVHHLISMAMEVHGAPRCDMDRFMRECACLFHNRRLRGHLSLSFCIQFFKQHVSITLQCVLAFVMKRKIALVNDACSRPPITIKSHNLHVGGIRGAMGKITSYHEKD